MDRARIVGLACEYSEKLHLERGIPKKEACRIVETAIKNVLARGDHGLGQTPDEELPGAIKAVKSTISPWLWALPIVSFTVAMVNAGRLSRTLKRLRMKI
jgi:hypothetical protein